MSDIWRNGGRMATRACSHNRCVRYANSVPPRRFSENVSCGRADRRWDTRLIFSSISCNMHAKPVNTSVEVAHKAAVEFVSHGGGDGRQTAERERK